MFPLPSVLTCGVSAQKNRPIETVLLSTHRICFGWEIRKLFSVTHSYLGGGGCKTGWSTVYTAYEKHQSLNQKIIVVYSCRHWLWGLTQKWVWSGSTTITHRSSTHCTVRESHNTCTVTRHPWDNKSKATISLFLFKMIANQERAQSNALQNKDKHRTPTNNGKYINQ